MRKLLLLTIVFASQSVALAQYSRYIIRLNDKAGSSFSVSDPGKFLSPRAIERRLRYQLPVEQSDLPVSKSYLDSIRLAGSVTVLNVSKWLNQVCIRTTDVAALEKISSFPFVLSAMPIAARMQSQGPGKLRLESLLAPMRTTNARPQTPADSILYGDAYPQISLHHAEFLHQLGFRGEGMQLAMMDAGFYHYLQLPAFDSIRNNNQVLGTWDFVDNEAGVDEDHPHGMSCLSTIAANMPGTMVGSSPKSSFYLYRTEDVSGEYPVEEQNWVAAAEKADSSGADVFSVSLGYNLFDNAIFNYSYADLDGNTSIIARGADLAARKGILVVVSAGNEGNAAWKYITTPADADSVLVVGAVNAARQVAGFSSYGPSADGQVKPDVVAIGQNAVVADPNSGAPVFGSGTSYACPILAGVVNCLWQAFPEVNNMGIIDALRKSSDKANMPDNRSGFGVPDARKAFISLLLKTYTGKFNVLDTCKAKMAFSLKAGNNMMLEVERKSPEDLGYSIVKTIAFNGDFSQQSADYTDELSFLPTAGTVSYRIKMTVADTSFYLDSAALAFSSTCGRLPAESIVLGANPVSNQLRILVTRNEAAKVQVNIYTVTGQKIQTYTQSVTGVQQLIIPLNAAARGVYLVTVFVNGKKQLSKKFLRAR
jgi:serine protease AprX